MEVSEPSISIFFMSKCLALAPYVARQNSKGVYTIQRSNPFLFYSSAVTLILVFFTYRGLMSNANSKIPIRASSRMMSATSKVVTALDVSVIAMAITAGVICGIVGVNATNDLNTKLRQVDDSLGSATNYKRERVKSIAMLLLSLTAMSMLMVFDVWTWLRFADTVQKGEHHTDVNVQWYIPFFSMYFILTGLHINFANTTLGLARRFEAVNTLLKESYLPAEANQNSYTKKNLKVATVRSTTSSTPTLQVSLSKFVSNTYQISAKEKSMQLKSLADCHKVLGKCIEIVSSAYGMAVLLILISCFLHLVATSYFLFIEIFSKEDNGFVWLEISWILFHSSRLLMVVEPCHRITRASKKTIHIICEIERIVHDPILAEENWFEYRKLKVKKFWQQLLVLKGDVSACGLCQVNRQLLTSLVSAIATYLVIIIQFQKSNG